MNEDFLRENIERLKEMNSIQTEEIAVKLKKLVETSLNKGRLEQIREEFKFLDSLDPIKDNGFKIEERMAYLLQEIKVMDKKKK